MSKVSRFYIPVRIDCLPDNCNIWINKKIGDNYFLRLLGITGKDLPDKYLKRYCYKMNKGYNDYILCKNRG